MWSQDDLSDLKGSVSKLYAISPNALDEIGFRRIYGLTKAEHYDKLRKACEKFNQYKLILPKGPPPSKKKRESSIVVSGAQGRRGSSANLKSLKLIAYDINGSKIQQIIWSIGEIGESLDLQTDIVSWINAKCRLRQRKKSLSDKKKELKTISRKDSPTSETKRKHLEAEIEELDRDVLRKQKQLKREGRALAASVQALEALENPGRDETIAGRVDGAYGVSGINDVLLRVTRKFPIGFRPQELLEIAGDILMFHYWPVISDVPNFAKKDFGVYLVTDTIKYRGAKLGDSSHHWNEKKKAAKRSDIKGRIEELSRLICHDESRREPVVCKADHLAADGNIHWEESCRTIDGCVNEEILIDVPSGSSDLSQHESTEGSEFLVFVNCSKKKKESTVTRIIRELIDAPRVRTIEKVKVFEPTKTEKKEKKEKIDPELKADMIIHFVGSHEQLHEMIAQIHNIHPGGKDRGEPATRIVTPIHSLLAPGLIDYEEQLSAAARKGPFRVQLRLARQLKEKCKKKIKPLLGAVNPYRALLLTETMVGHLQKRYPRLKKGDRGLKTKQLQHIYNVMENVSRMRAGKKNRNREDYFKEEMKKR